MPVFSDGDHMSKAFNPDQETVLCYTRQHPAGVCMQGHKGVKRGVTEYWTTFPGKNKGQKHQVQTQSKWRQI